ncbi:MAG: hypothetical protein II395_09075, partial [Ruminococcus sp.]|nr:hypothetical protein [Ruminococcus sp.]
ERQAHSMRALPVRFQFIVSQKPFLIFHLKQYTDYKRRKKWNSWEKFCKSVVDYFAKTRYNIK